MLVTMSISPGMADWVSPNIILLFMSPVSYLQTLIKH